MKRTLLWTSFCAIIAVSGAIAAPIASGSAISAGYSGNGVIGSESVGIPSLNAYRKHRAIDALVQEGRRMQRVDGGTLTKEHHAYLQSELNAILAGNY
ncbi:MAG TPA: hypothetical protein VGK90_00985 [Rhizomicrobium sp.]|jgi:hypothetical protein